MQTFAFWCRRANIDSLKQAFDQRTRLGRGLAFHIAPANVPINFAFSFAFGLLAGNANIVRVPSREFPQTAVVCRAVARVLAQPAFAELKTMTAFVRYERNDEITGSFSAACDARVIWGGDATVRQVRLAPVRERCVEVVFADRYSLSILHAPAVLAADETSLQRLAEDFYNDSYLMDQDACSSPHLVIWHGAGAAEAKARFWPAVHSIVNARYHLAPEQAVEKYSRLCTHAIEGVPGEVTRHGNAIYRRSINELPERLDTWRGRFGYFNEFETGDLSALARVVTDKYQTLSYFGIDRSVLREFVVAGRLAGIDRIVPIGKALDMSVTWDGYDIISTLSRIVEIR